MWDRSIDNSIYNELGIIANGLHMQVLIENMREVVAGGGVEKCWSLTSQYYK